MRGAVAGCGGGRRGRTVRLVTYNVGVFNKYVRDDYRLVAGLLREVRPDAVCLNELDSCTARTRGVFQLERIAGMMGGWDFRFGAAMPFDGGSYGEGVMTRERAVRKEAVALPEAGGAEPRVLVVVELPDYVIATTHLDHVSPEAQLEQVRTINREMMRRYGDSPKPVFLGGRSECRARFRDPPAAGTDVAGAHPDRRGTYPSDEPEQCIDYLLQLRNGVRCEVTDARVLRRFGTGDVSRASDHLPVLLEVRW